MQSFLTDFFSQSGQLGTNPLLSALPAVPNSVSLLREAAGGLSAVMPSEVPLTESPGEVLPMTQEDLPPPNVSVHDVSLVRGVVSSGGGGGPFSLAAAIVLGMTLRTNCELVVFRESLFFLLFPLCLLLRFSFLHPTLALSLCTLLLLFLLTLLLVLLPLLLPLFMLPLLLLLSIKYLT